MDGRELLADPGGVRIPHAEILPALRRVHESGVRHYDDALCLHRANRAQEAIPSFVLAVEEYLKGIYLAIAHGEGRDITHAEWDRLKRRDFKLLEVKRCLDGKLDGKALEKIYADYSHWDLDIVTGTRSMFSRSAAECDSEVTDLTGILQTLKRACTYHNWNRRVSEWDPFESLSAYARRSLAFHVMHIAKCYHELFVHSVGDNLELPCARTCDSPSPIPKNPFRFYASRSVLQAFKHTRSILACPHRLTLDIIGKSRVIGEPSAGASNSHPLVRSISAFVSDLPTLQDGRHKYPSDDSGQTPDGKPTLSASISVHVEAGLGTLELVTINGAECDIYDSRIAIALEAEKIIERKPGPEMSKRALAALFSALGIRSYRFTDKNILHALKNARELLEGGYLYGYPERMVDHIRSATPENWLRMDPQARNVISALYLHDPAAIALDEHKSLMQKRRARVMAWDVICAQKVAYDNIVYPILIPDPRHDHRRQRARQSPRPA